MKKFVLFLLFCLLLSSNVKAEDSVLEKFINKRIDGCKVTNVEYSEKTKDILITCEKDNGKVYHFYLDIKAGFECGDFQCGSENVTKEVIELLNN